MSRWPNCVIAGCPLCGRATRLPAELFPFDAELKNLLVAENMGARLACGAEVSLREGEWRVHKSCARDARSA